MVENVNGHEVTAIEGGTQTFYRCRRCEKSLSDVSRFDSVQCIERG